MADDPVGWMNESGYFLWLFFLEGIIATMLFIEGDKRAGRKGVVAVMFIWWALLLALSVYVYQAWPDPVDYVQSKRETAIALVLGSLIPPAVVGGAVTLSERGPGQAPLPVQIIALGALYFMARMAALFVAYLTI